MTRPRTLPLSATSAATAAGVLLAHWIAYLLAFPDAGTRAAVLAHAGHGYWSLAVKGVVPLAAAGLAVVLSRAFLEQDPADSRITWLERWSALTARLAALQVGAFLVLEVAERAVAGMGGRSLFAGSVLALGLALQVLVAGVAALALLCLARTAARIVGAFRVSTRVGPVRPRIGEAGPAHHGTLVLAGASGVRGPPLS